jgi:NADH:ubiquinone oxidoreductase subunit 6 (subunit J)
MLLLKLTILSSVLVFFINIIFCFNRTVYILLTSLLLFLLTSFIFIFFEFEFLGLMFATIYVGGIAVMFLFLILTVDVRVENTERVFIWRQMVLSKLVFSIIFSMLFSFIFLYFCDPMMFASVDFYLYCNHKILFT